VAASVVLSVFGTLAFGIDFPAVNSLSNRTQTAEIQSVLPPPAATQPAVAVSSR
jgi:hypothetical protein